MIQAEDWVNIPGHKLSFRWAALPVETVSVTICTAASVAEGGKARHRQPVCRRLSETRSIFAGSMEEWKNISEKAREKCCLIMHEKEVRQNSKSSRG